MAGPEKREIADIQLEMDGIQEGVAWLLSPSLKDGAENHDISTVEQRALQLLASGILIDDQRAEVVAAAVRWLQLAAQLTRLGVHADMARAPGNQDGSNGL